MEVRLIDADKLKKHYAWWNNEQQRDFDAIVDAQPTELRWIRVEERLPEPCTRVIGFMAWKSIMTVEYQNGRWYNIDHLEHMPDEAVTHWMPLPEVPE